jgi:hypothetical protein
MSTGAAPGLIEEAPNRIWLHELSEILNWYEQNLCAHKLTDPRGHSVGFSLERFPHLIKLLNKNSTREVEKPQKQALAIRDGRKNNRDFGGYDAERVQTLSWISAMILRPTRILELTAQPLVGQEKPGDTLYVKEFRNTGRKYRYKILVCRRVGAKLLVPVTCHPREHDRYPKQYRQVYP